MITVALWTLKGGVGKTATCVNLAYLAASAGLRTLLWDLDAQGASSFTFRVAPRKKLDARALVRRSTPLEPWIRATDYENLDLLPAGLSLRHLDLELAARRRPLRRLAVKLAPLAASYDLVLLDCPPGVSVISEAVLRAVDAVLCPVIPTPLSLRSLEHVRRLVAPEETGAPTVLPFLSMVDRRKALHRQIAARYANGEEGFLRTAIPLASVVERMGLRRAPVTAFAPKSAAARAYAALWQELVAALARPSSPG
ncbi:MAG: ParA family protein [Thermoanaerobaculaceae bacterium]|nr:ParA family protein [Thermoanaerobaculaceae bacterium]